MSYTLLTLAPGVVLPDKLAALFGEMPDWDYGWGFKIEPLDLQGAELIGTNPENGQKGEKVDCSGMFEWVVYHLTGGQTTVPAGSVQIHEWLGSHGFETLPVAAGHDRGQLMAAVWPETDEHPGHIMLLFNDIVWESCADFGPTHVHQWGEEAFHAECIVYRLI